MPQRPAARDRTDHNGRRTRVGRWAAVIAAAAGVVALPLALLNWLFPDPLPALDPAAQAPPPQTGSASPSTSRSTAAGGSTAAAADPFAQPSTDATSKASQSDAAARLLADLQPLSGEVEVDSTTVRVPCGSGQSDDRQRRVTYELPQGYTRFETTLTASDDASPDAVLQLTIATTGRSEGSARKSELAAPVVRASDRRAVSVALVDADRLVVELTCERPTSTAVLLEPRLLR